MKAVASLIALLAACVAFGATSTPDLSDVNDPNTPYDVACARLNLSRSECVGRIIWFKATLGNARFYTYTFPQRIGIWIDWFRVLRSDQRDDRFAAWGLVNDPACCRPGESGCPARRSSDTYGFDWCPGDDVLLQFVGRNGYVDPACKLEDAPLFEDDVHTKGGTIDQRQSSCDLQFGTSVGVLGFRKFPNPGFDRARWEKLNGDLGTWEGFARPMIAQTGVPSDARVSKVADGSIEPPFLIGITCGSCHIGLDPANPPRDPAHPQWENIKGVIGNQYLRMHEVLTSGMPDASLERQMFVHPRPGAVDTSAIANDQINNPGAINSVFNLARRPTFAGEAITKWRKTDRCSNDEDEDACWCEPGRDGKCWRLSTRSDDVTVFHSAGRTVTLPGVHHMLKGGEDSIGAAESIPRVYLNSGSCAEECWVNHLTDFRQLDPSQRLYGQTPLSIGACRRDCAGFRAIEDRLDNVVDFLFSTETDAADLAMARDNGRRAADPSAPRYTRQDLVRDLESEFGPDAVGRGRRLFAENCARCHSSMPSVNSDASADFYGNDVATPASEVGTFRCRALHSNHMSGHLYSEYAATSVHARPVVAGIPERTSLKDGGRGYYRNISLLNVWATAPFMHNNAIGPEICGKPKASRNDFDRPRYVDAQDRRQAAQPACVPYDPSVEGRFSLYKRSMDELLHPDKRGRKITLTTDGIVIDLGVRSWDGTRETALAGPERVTIAAGVPVTLIEGLQYKDLISDLYAVRRDPSSLRAERGSDVARDLRTLAQRMLSDPSDLATLVVEKPDWLVRYYETCTQLVENEGHRFGEDLSEADKNALIAFVATL